MSNTAKWSDTEKLALFVSIIKAHGPKINWANVQLPAGRSKQACYHVYNAAMNDTKAVPMASSADNEAGIKKRGPKKGTAVPKKPPNTATKKRKRGGSAALMDIGESEKDSGDEAVEAAKKAKKESKEEDGDVEDFKLGEDEEGI